ncbi:heme-degrading domain-containing protein [Actinotalea sp. M2MS4P-6]|uniref:heme-degrading domain-containing protein n=1 Tax=Actinotalea sp. M2MS4P-6 TaxID=2983762 RepID=UPI0021E4333D|nr:heme-degrading domain-containing protein [Actinotalea sp. M2MS4P-6]MCV2394622.1 heme-degrading domain-containing protein [Actinotalea sp. M2MS4P-6]
MSDSDIVAHLEAEHARLVLEHFDHADAWTLGCAIVELAQERSLPVAIDIHLGRQQVFHAAMPGSTAENDLWIARKRAVAELTGRPSFLVGRRHAAAGTDFHAATGLPAREYATHGGAVPLVVRGVGQVGVATVSGLPQAQDHALVVEAIEQTFDIA